MFPNPSNPEHPQLFVQPLRLSATFFNQPVSIRISLGRAKEHNNHMLVFLNTR